MAVCSPDHLPTYNPHLVLTLADRDVIYDFRALSQSINKGLFSWEMIEAHLDSILPYSGYELCPGIKQYLTAVHFESKHSMYTSSLHTSITKMMVASCGMFRRTSAGLCAVQCL